MGLDVVELVVRCEDVFAITLQDEDMGRVQTVGDLYVAICKELKLVFTLDPMGSSGCARISRASRTSNLPGWTAEDVWATLRATVIDQLQVDKEDVTPTARFRDDLGAD